MNKSVLITGNRKGIGRYLSEVFLSKGWTVYGCSREQSDLKHKNYIHYITDVSNEKDVVKMFSSIRKNKHGLYAILNNAGIASMNHILMTPGKTIKKVTDVNFIGTALCCREASKIMLKKKIGRIINFSTIACPINLAGEAIYAASKTAVESYSKTLSKEVAPFNITVNIIGPNPIKTELISGVSDQKLDKLIHSQTIKRYGKYDDILNIVEFFIKEESSMITGQTIYLAGIS